MLNKLKNGKLTLQRETLRRLSATQLRGAAGAFNTATCPNFTCVCDSNLCTGATHCTTCQTCNVGCEDTKGTSTQPRGC